MRLKCYKIDAASGPAEGACDAPQDPYWRSEEAKSEVREGKGREGEKKAKVREYLLHWLQGGWLTYGSVAWHSGRTSVFW